MNAIYVIDKEKGCTSRDVVNLLSKKFNIKKLGHAGTLDPLATGVLVIASNRATKCLEFLLDHDKEYIATVLLGKSTDTLDITGKVIEEVKDFSIDVERLKEVLSSFQGTYLQEVPMYSAVQKNGKRLYEYARSNQQIELPKREVSIEKIELLEFKNVQDETFFSFQTTVSKGTYIRSLIRDIGEKLNIPCTMVELRRIRQGDFTLAQAKRLDKINLNDGMIIDEVLRKMFLVYRVAPNRIKWVSNGGEIKLPLKDEYVLLEDEDHQLIALYQKQGFIYRSRRQFHNK